MRSEARLSSRMCRYESSEIDSCTGAIASRSAPYRSICASFEKPVSKP